MGERNTLRILSLLCLIAAWELLSLRIRPLFLPAPWSVAQAVVSLTKSGVLLSATWGSFKLFIFGFVIAIAIAVPIGLILGRSERAFHFFESYITIMWSTPTIALLPLLVIWFGLTFTTQLVVVILSAVFPVILNTEVGVRNVDDTLLEVADCFGARRRERLFYIIWPAAVPYIATGIRVGVGRAIIGVVVAELFTTVSGLGGQMTYYSNTFQTANYFAVLFVFVVFSLILTEVVTLLERRYTRWRQ